jgi:hypothetical protein
LCVGTTMSTTGVAVGVRASSTSTLMVVMDQTVRSSGASGCRGPCEVPES